MECDDITLSIVEEDDIIFNVDGEANPTSFIFLNDTPESYSGQSGKLLSVNSTEDGIEFTDSPTLVDWDEIGGNQSDVSLSGFTDNMGIGSHISNLSNPHQVTKTQVGLSNVNNTSDLNKPISTATQQALDLKYNSSSFNTDWDSRLATKTTDNLTEGTNKYDKTVALTAGDGIQVTGTYPNFTITNVSEGNTDHSELDNLDYANSGHTGFQPAGNYLTSESDPVFTSSQAYNITQTDITNLSNLSGTNSGDQESSDFEIKDLTDSNNLRTTWSGKQDALTAGTNINITNNTISATDTTYSSGDFNLSSLGDVDDTDKAEGKILQVDSEGKHVYVTNAGGSDEKVKYDSNDTTAGYLSDKIIAGDGISLSEGIGTDENKLVITNTGGGATYTAGSGIDITENVISNTGVLTESDPVFTNWDKSTGISITESQISDFGSYLTSETDPVWTSEKGNYQATSEKGQNNGYASLDAGGKVPVSELPNSIIEYKGTWNASNNTPTLIDGTGNAGDVYIVSVAGTHNFGSGDITFLEGDWVMYNGTIWQKSINSNAVVSVNTQTGVVTLDADDISDTSTTNKFVTSTDITNLGNLSGTNSGDQESSDFSLAGLSDVDDTAKATGKILQVNADGDHEYVSIPSPDLSSVVPYTGATTDVDLGNYDLTTTGDITAGNLSGSNSGDQTNMSGISDTKENFNASLNDGSFAFSGGAFHDGFSDFVANEHIDWTTSQVTPIHSDNYTDTTYTASDFDIKDLTDSTNLMTSWTGKLDSGGWYDTTQNLVSLSGFSNDSGFISGLDWDEIGGNQTDINLSGFTDDLIYENPLTFSSPLSREVDTISVTQATITTDGYLSSTDWNTFNGKQDALTEGTDYEVPLTFSTGLTRTTNTITCDITQYTDSDAVSAIKADEDWNATDWDSAYNWGDHSTEGYLKSETDPLSLHLDQTSPQTFTAGDVSGSGLLKVTLGVLGLDTTTYVSGTPWTSEGYITDADSDGKIYGRKDGGWTEVTGGGATDLVDLGDVVITNKATGKILQVNADGDHEYVDLPDPDVSGLVPYTGATGDVTLGNYDLTLTDLNSTGNIILSNNKYLQAVDVAGTGKIDILKVNTSDEVEAGSKFNFGLLEFAPRTEPISPDIDGLYLYEVASGTTPAREIKLVAKNHLGEEIIAFTSIV